MDRITRFSLKNPTVLVVATLLVLFGGIYATGELKRETMPDVAIPIAAVVTPYPGAAPVDVHDKVTDDMATAVMGVPGIENVTSTSADSVSVVVAEFGFSQDMDEAENEITQAIDGVDLPENAMDSEVTRISFGSAPILKLTAEGGQSPEDLSMTVQDVVVPALEAVDGVGEVKTSHDDPGSVKIIFDPEALEEHGLSANDVIQQLQASNLSFPVGSVTIDQVEEPIRVSGTLASVDDIASLEIVKYPNMNEFMGEALATMGEGMGALGEGMGQLGGAVGQIGGAVGELGAGMGELGMSMGSISSELAMQIGYVSGIQEVQAQLFESKMAYAQAQAVINNPASTPQEIAIAQATIAQLDQVIPVLEQTLEELKAKLAASQKAMMEAAQDQDMTLPADQAPSSDGMAMSAPAGGGTATLDAEEPTIELVTLDELAEITYDPGVGSMFSRSNGEAAILIDIIKTQDANTVDVSEGVVEAVEELTGEPATIVSERGLFTGVAYAAEGVALIPDDIDLAITYDASVQINGGIWDMVREGLLGAFFAFLVILVFLRNWRATIIAAVSIPLSVIIALLFIYWAGISLNMMTLGGLAVAIGRVVDDSIVVIENIFRHMQIGDKRNTELIRVATKEVSTAITSATLTTVAVFAPMAFVSGIVGKVFTPFAVSVALAVIASLLVSVTVVPLLSKWLLLGSKVKPVDEEEVRTDGWYGRLLAWSLGHKKSVLAVAALLFVGALALIPIVGTGFMPPTAEKYVTIDVSYPAGTSPEVVDDALLVIEDGLTEMDEVVYFQTTVGAASGFTFGSSTNQGTIFVKVDEDADPALTIASARVITEPLEEDGASVSIAQVDITGASANSVEVLITGPNFDDIEETADELVAAFEGIDGLENISSNVSEVRPQITVDVDQVAAAGEGINAAMIAGAVRGYVAEQSAGTIDVDGRDLDMMYQTDPGEVSSVDTVANAELQTPLGETILIKDVARVEETETPVAVLSRNGSEFAAVTAGVTERDSSTVISAMNEEIAKMEVPDGVEIEISGMAEMMDDAFKQLGLAMIIAVAAVYLVMVIAFGEAIAPLAIMFSLPLAIIGSVVALLIAGIPLDMSAMIGVLMLIGIVTTNAIVLIDRVQQKLKEGLPRREAILVAGSDRIRPVLMTALTTIFALMPLALSASAGALMSQSLAITVIGGLTTSTILTLVVVPVVFDMLEGWKASILGEEHAERNAMAS